VCVHGFMLVGLSRLNVRVSTVLRSLVYHDLMYARPRFYAHVFITTLCTCVHGFMLVGLSRLLVSCQSCVGLESILK
jgi:hypothetical protein